MKITNQSMSAVTVMEEGEAPRTLTANSKLETTARKVTVQVHYVPCQIEIEAGDPAVTSQAVRQEPPAVDADAVRRDIDARKINTEG